MWTVKKVEEFEQDYYTLKEYSSSISEGEPIRKKGASFEATFIPQADLNIEFSLGIRWLGKLAPIYIKYVLGQEVTWDYDLLEKCQLAKGIIRNFLIGSNKRETSRMGECMRGVTNDTIKEGDGKIWFRH